MGILDNVERGLERVVNGAFARTFRSGVQPVEIASALKRELDIGAVVVDRDRVLAPNRFAVRVSPKDADRLHNLGETLEQELRGVVRKHAESQNYQLLGDPDVEIVSDDSLTPGVLEIDALRVEGRVDWIAVIDVEGARHELRRGTTTVGRGTDCGIRIGDSAASRKHLEIIWDGAAGIARDLGSTNGSKINGQRFREAALTPDTVITIGQTGLHFRLVPGRDRSSQQRQQPQRPQQQPQQQRRPDPAPQATPVHNNRPAAGSQSNTQSGVPDIAPSIDQDFWRGL
ncbi:MAG: FhaA domain-containing protein [Leucobacter sp.]